MTKKQKEINKKIKAVERLAGMFKANGANRIKTVKGYRFILKNEKWKIYGHVRIICYTINENLSERP